MNPLQLRETTMSQDTRRLANQRGYVHGPTDHGHDAGEETSFRP